MRHDTWLELADVYAADALDADERARFEAHLAEGCAACEARLHETREALTLLPRALPPAMPPPSLRGRVLERIAEPPSAPASPGPPPPARAAGRRGRALWWAGGAGLAAAAALLAVVNVELASTRREMAGLRDRVATLQAQLAEREETLRLLSDPSVRSVSLAGLKPSPGASGWLLWDPTTRRGLLLARDLPPAPPGKVYELWAIAGAEPVPAGLFTVDPAGRGLLRLSSLPAGPAFTTFAVTLEPGGGVPKPTGPIHLLGKL
jgi:anti-sigma-K factor RskA